MENQEVAVQQKGKQEMLDQVLKRINHYDNFQIV